MELEHRFELPVGVEKAFPALLDLNLLGSCFPGAHVDNVDGDTFTGSVKAKIGPIPLHYQGTARFVEKDHARHSAVIEANGSAPRGGSTATMLVHATAEGVAPNRTAVVLVTNLAITGRAANFGRQAMIDVGNELISRFANCASGKLAGREAGGATLLAVVNPDEVAAESVGVETEVIEVSGPAAPAVSSRSSALNAIRARRAHAPKVENPPVQLLSAAKQPLLTQLLPVLGGLALALLILFKKPRSRTSDTSD